MCFRLVMVACALAVACGMTLAQEDVYLEGVYYDDIEPLVLDVQEPAAEPAGAADAGTSMSNDDVVAMLNAEFSETLIKAVMDANETAFDVSPRALLELKAGGVSETLIEAMLAAEAARKQSGPALALAEPVLGDTLPADEALEESALAAPQVSLEGLAVLTQAIEKLATAAPAASEPLAVSPANGVDDGPGPHAWLADTEARLVLSPTFAQVAFTDTKSTGTTALNTLESLGSRKALVFMSPALAVAQEIGGLFRSNDPTTTAIWALPGASAAQALALGAELEVEFGSIPGINPNDYRPAIVQLVPTIDNFRLVGAAKTKVSDLDTGAPTSPIIEETVPAKLTQVERGRYRVAVDTGLAPGEYALVLRRVDTRQRKRNAPASLGELLGTGAGNLLYVTWDFSIKEARRDPQ